jgi:hypothetical protein
MECHILDQGAIVQYRKRQGTVIYGDSVDTVRRHSPAVRINDVTNESLPINRQRTSLDISTEVRSNDSSWRDGGYEGDTSSPPAGGFKKRKVGYLAAFTNDDGSSNECTIKS